MIEDQSSVMTTTNDFNEKSVTQISIPPTHFKPKSGKSNKRGTLKSRNVVSSKFNVLLLLLKTTLTCEIQISHQKRLTAQN